MKTDYTIEELQVGDLEIDLQVQRSHLNLRKVERIKKDFNPNAVGVIDVSRRKDGQVVVLDGMHRVQAIKELTDGAGTILCKVHEGLTLQEEAAMFLDLNMGDRPTSIDKYRVSVVKGDPVATAIEELVTAYHWEVNAQAGKGHINAVQALERLYRLSEKMEAEPNLLQSFLLVVTRAWGDDRYATQAPLVEGLGRFLAEHTSQIDMDRLVDKLKNYRGGPQTLIAEATQVANLRKMRTSMAVADLITQQYNRGIKTHKLSEWRHRS